jgi:peptidoglycan/LPS O-acetylase OafA/YrhL
MSNALRYRPDVDGLRAVAVTLVLLFHLEISRFSGGFVGVDVFFVISGFLITSKIVADLNRGSFSLVDFYLARTRRIVPALMATVISTCLVAGLIYSPAALKELSESAISALASVSNVYFWMTSGYFDAAAETKALLHTWSLGVEEQFYLVWPLLLIWAFKRQFIRPMVLLGIVLGFTIVAELMLLADASGAYFLLPARFGELALGGLVAVMPERAHARRLVEAGFLGGLLFVILPAFVYTQETRFPGVSALIPCLGTAALIYFGKNAKAAILLANRPCVAIGKISYSLYLVHWPVIVLTKYYLMRPLSDAETLAATFVIVVLAGISYRLVEKPFRETRSAGFRFPTRRLLLTLGTVLGIAVVPLGWAVTDGMVWRNPAALGDLHYLGQPKKFHAEYYGGRGCEPPRCETQPDQGKPIAYVWGDSHARALVEGLRSEVPEVNFIVYAPSACLLVSEVYITARGSASCPDARRLAFEELKNSPAPLFMHQSWLGHVELPVYRSDDPSTVLDTFGTTKFGRFVADQADAVHRLSGQPVLVLGAVPMSGMTVSPVDCVTRPLRTDVECEQVARSNHAIKGRAEFNDALRPNITSGVSFFDPFDYLCDREHCFNFTSEGKPVYSDTGHLSIWGSRLLVSRMRDRGAFVSNADVPSIKAAASSSSRP